MADRKRRSLVAAATVTPLAAAGCERRASAEGAIGPVKTWLKLPQAAPSEIPADYLGMHTDHGVNPKTAAPSYPYDAVRNYDVDDAYEMPPTHWARIEREPGKFHWKEVDQWMDAQRGKTLIWTLVGCPKFYQRYPGEPWAYPYLPGGGSPPRNAADAAAFISALLERYRGRIHFIEVWNEPNFGRSTNALIHRWTPNYGQPAFFTGTAADLAQLARAIRQVLPGTVKLMGCAWADQSRSSDRYNGVLRFSEAPDGVGGRGKDHLDVLSVHSYTFDGDPNKMVRELIDYDECFAKAGYPKSMPRYLTECGAEKPKSWSAQSPPMAEKIRNIRRWCMVPAALGYRGIYLYKHSLMRTLGDPSRTPEIAAAIGEIRNQLRGRVIDRAAELTDGSIWLRFKDGEDLRA